MHIAKKIMIKAGIFEPFKGLAAGQSTRHGGVSPAPWNSLNLGKNTADQPENVSENRHRFAQALGFDVATMAWSKQVHGTAIKVVNKPGSNEGFDALITNVKGILLAVSVADCTPILLFDKKNNAIAAIHAGWKGSAGMLVTKTLNLMAQEYGTKGADCYAYIGTCIAECSFEVGDEVAVQFDPAFTRWDAQRSKYMVDLKKANAAQCIQFGIPENQLETSPFCTVIHNEDFFSHRKEKGVTGRMIAAIGMG